MKLGVNERLRGKKLYREVWKPVILLDSGESYEGSYEVSNMGRVRSLDRCTKGKGGSKCLHKGKIIKTRKNKCGYVLITLNKDNKKKTYSVHRLVGFAFRSDSWFENAHIDHINTIKDDNRVVNLRWVTRSENMGNSLTHEKMSGENNKNRRKVICIETGQVFNSIKEAGEYVGVANPTNISTCCTGKCKTIGGYHWAYYGCSEEEIKRKLNEGKSHDKKVICIETGRVFDSLKEAGKYVGVASCNISKCCSGGCKTVKGYHWAYYPCSEEEMEEKLNKGIGKSSRRVICVETGQVFNSIKEASESMDIGRASISACLAGRNKTSGGYHFKYLEDYLKEVS